MPELAEADVEGESVAEAAAIYAESGDVVLGTLEVTLDAIPVVGEALMVLGVGNMIYEMVKHAVYEHSSLTGYLPAQLNFTHYCVGGTTVTNTNGVLECASWSSGAPSELAPVLGVGYVSMSGCACLVKQQVRTRMLIAASPF